MEKNMPQGDIKVVVKFGNGGRKSYSLISALLNSVNYAIFQSELADLGDIEREFTEIPITALDAARYRTINNRGRAYLIEHASSGSIILGGIAAGLAIWFLQQTLGESIKEAWKETDLHKRIKQFLLAGRLKKAEQIAKSIELDIDNQSRFLAENPKVRIEIEGSPESTTTITVYVEESGDKEPVPTASDVLAKL